MMQTDKDFTNEDDESLNPCHQISISNALKVIKNPVKCCQRMHALIQELNKTIEAKRKEFDDDCEDKICFLDPWHCISLVSLKVCTMEKLGS